MDDINFTFGHKIQFASAILNSIFDIIGPILLLLLKSLDYGDSALIARVTKVMTDSPPTPPLRGRAIGFPVTVATIPQFLP
ncbi:MAG: hypothetical protein QUV08_13380 [Parasphingorhabdus sp.]|nr:hypothetical protein [Parasphingorhabdus sp.]